MTVTEPFDIVILGLSITSSWGNGHATTYRSLASGLAKRGHRILFLERNAEWYENNRDEPNPVGVMVGIYESFDELISRFEHEVARARFVILGSFVPEGARIADWLTSITGPRTAFYDIDTPITLAQLRLGQREFIARDQIPRFDAYLSFTGGPLLRQIESEFGVPMARPLYCSVDPQRYRPLPPVDRWHLGYLGTYSPDRQPLLEELLLEPARRWPEGRFAVMGPMYPAGIAWPSNVVRDIHLSPREHPGFYSSQRFTLNITRAEMKKTGYSPSVRLFEAGACAVPVISDWWDGLDCFFKIGEQVLVASNSEDVLRILRDLSPERRREIGQAARSEILAKHTAERRAMELESYMREIDDNAAADTSRGHRRRGKHTGWMASGVAPESTRLEASGGVDEEPGGSPYSRYLQQPTGTLPGNGGSSGETARTQTKSADGTGGNAHGHVGGPEIR